MLAVVFVLALIGAYRSEKRSQMRLRNNVIPGSAGPLSSTVLLVAVVGFVRGVFPDHVDLVASIFFVFMVGAVIGYTRMVFTGISRDGEWK